MEDGFIDTVFDLFKNSIAIGLFIVTMTVLVGMARIHDGLWLGVIIAAILAVNVAAVLHVKRQINKRRLRP